MAWTQLTSNVESFSSDKINEVIQINSLKDLKETLWVDNLSWIEEEFKKPLLTSKKELLRIKEELTRDETSVKLKEFLEDKWIIWVIWEKFHRATETFKEKYAWKEAKEKMENWAQDLLSDIEWAWASIKNNKTVIEWTKKAKEVISKWKDAVAGLWFMAKLESMAEKWGAMWGLASFILMILGIFGFWKKAEEIGDKLKEKLSPEEIEKTKKQIKEVADKTIDTININIEKSGFTLLPSARSELYKIMEEPNFLKPEELALINQRLKEGKIKSLSDIAPFIWEVTWDRYLRIKSALFNEEQKQYLKEWMRQNVEKSISKKYWVELNALESEKRQKLRELVKQYRVTDDVIEIAEKFEKKEGVEIWELFNAGAMAWANLSIFTIKLITNWIIWASDYTSSFVSKSSEIISIWLNWLWINVPVTGDVLEKIKNLPDEEKKFMFWVMWREWQVWISLLKNITFFTSRWLIETAIWDVWSSTVTWYNSLLNNFESKISSLEKLETAFIWKPSWVANEALKHTRVLIKEMEIVSLLKKHWNNIPVLKQELTKLWSNPHTQKILSEINNGTNIGKIRKNFWDELWNISRSSQKWINIKEASASLWKWDFSQTEKALYDYYKWLDVIRDNNKRLLSWSFDKLNWKVKFRDFIESMKLSRNGNRVILEWSLQEQVHTTTMLKKMANDAPWLLGNVLGTAMLTLSFVWLSKEVSDDDKSYLTAIQDNLKYAIPTIWPINTIRHTKINKLDTKATTELASMTIFWLMDLSAVTWFAMAWEWWKIVSYHTRFLTAPVYLPWQIANQVRTYNTFRKSWWKLSLDLFKNRASSMSKIFKTKNFWVLAAWVALLWVSVFMESWKEKELKRLKEEWFIEDDKFNYEKIKEKLSYEEKKYFLEEIIFNNWNGVTATIEWDKLSVVSKNKEIQWIWIITKLMDYDLLDALWVDIDKIDFKYIEA